MVNRVVDSIIDNLYHWVSTYRGRDLVKDTTRIRCAYDAFISSSPTEPLSFTIFEMTSKGELLVDDPSRVAGSEAAYFLFVNTETKWLVAVKNTTENQKKIIRKEALENFRVKIIS